MTDTQDFLFKKLLEYYRSTERLEYKNKLLQSTIDQLQKELAAKKQNLKEPTRGKGRPRKVVTNEQ
jgi:response regulator of citrate/malate metabolism